ncbi:hypothetical protein K1T71_005796 [Dendrolimus kikuchii]|uniref:Uncharacterized protein n=1 Tax=Dendrolimus kikuchii TaxID=765133 RepID=A0ACC1D582_9NEOP|nr:hypothetical protein K1T71_005796 [Dendrolimus kikuchii]
MILSKQHQVGKMRLLILIIAALAVCDADPQYTKSVKSGYNSKNFQHNENMVSLFGNHSHTNTQYGGNTNQLNQSRSTGICFIEVPTVSLVKDRSNVPKGNGSRSDLSSIRSCCPGYIRNIHNYMICDPVCSEECVNGLCVAPETCSCFPEHVKNEAGFCVATCPIGCQNGRCDGGECMCNKGYKLHNDGKYCVPICDQICWRNGNCTAPNTCVCNPGYNPAPEGACIPHCTACSNGQCIGPNECRCLSGYYKDEKGDCKARCERGCTINGICSAPNICTYPGGVRVPSGQDPMTTTPANYPQPNLQRPNSYPYPTNTQSNYHGHHYQPQQPVFGNNSLPSNGSQPVQNPNPVYYVPSRPNGIPFNPDSQLGSPANSTQSINSPNQPGYPNNYQPGYPYQQNYPNQPNYNQNWNQPQNPNFSLAPFPSPSSNNTNRTTPNQSQPIYQYPQSNPPPGFFFNPYGGYYQPIFSGYLSNYTGVPYNPNNPQSQPIYYQYPNQPLYPGQPGYTQNGPYFQPGYNQPFPTNHPGYGALNLTHDLNKNQSSVLNQPNYQPSGYPIQPDNHHHTYSYQPGYPYPQDNPNPQGYFYNPAMPNQPGQSNQQSNLNQLDYYQKPTNYNQLNNQVEFLEQPKYMNMTTFTKQDSPDTPVVPSCSVPCVNAECVSGNRCVCGNGYVALTDETR